MVPRQQLKGAMLTFGAHLGEAKVYQSQLIPDMVTLCAVHDVAACDIQMCCVAAHVQQMHCLRNFQKLILALLFLSLKHSN